MLVRFLLACPITAARRTYMSIPVRDSLLRGATIAVEDHATNVLLSVNGTLATCFYDVSPTVFTFCLVHACRRLNSRKIYSFTREAFFATSGHFLASDNATFDAADLGRRVAISRWLTLDTDDNLKL
ncbi:hypothetical protein E2562_021084 [Oryza meyeriana var. granulata]|uniref:Uncharacterized protein n=1 Tax=Oryza meyeriana var. granulata TaxID=110450 RepID=A0A6G1BLW2_9ORYZ|nr:hypothetical protein E2562_021084 [Oryza meyeriana var. granulata]